MLFSYLMVVWILLVILGLNNFDKFNMNFLKGKLTSFINTPFLMVYFVVLFFYLFNFMGFSFGSLFLWFSFFLCFSSWFMMFITLLTLRFWMMSMIKFKSIFELTMESITIFSRSISLTVRLSMNTFMGFLLIVGLHFIVLNITFLLSGFLFLLYELGIILLQIYILSFLSEMYLLN